MKKDNFIIGLPFLSAVLMWLSYHPANLSFLAWISYVPLFAYLFIKAGQSGFFCRRFPFVTKDGFKYLLIVYAAGFLFFVLGLWWLNKVTWAGMVLIPLILALYWVTSAIISYFIIRVLPVLYAALSIVLLWVFWEYLRSFVLTGFPWFYAGHTQYQWLSFIQIVDIAGVYAISFVVLMVNSAVFLLIKEKAALPLRNITYIVMTAAIFAGVLIYGGQRLKNLRTAPGPQIGIVQANIPQTLKMEAKDAEQAVDDIYDKHLNLTYRLLDSGNPDLIVWAETMLPKLIMLDDDYDDGMEMMKSTARLANKPMLIGALTCVESKGTEYKFVTRDEGTSVYHIQLLNSAFYLDAKGEILGRYDKSHLVPVSEYVPLRRTFPFIDSLIMTFSELPYIAELSSGTNLEPFTLPVSRNNQTRNYKYGVQVCYESIFPDLTRQSVRNGAEFIINISNDGWFQNSAELDQILVLAAFRAAENKIGFIRATNTGISAIISPSGKITELADKQGRIKEVEGAWIEPAELAEWTGSFYTRHGDKFPWLCLIFLGLFFALKFKKT